MPVTDFTDTISKLDAAIIVIAERAHEHATKVLPRERCRASEFAATLRDLAQARELLEVAQERTEPARRAQRSAEIARDFERVSQ